MSAYVDEYAFVFALRFGGLRFIDRCANCVGGLTCNQPSFGLKEEFSSGEYRHLISRVSHGPDVPAVPQRAYDWSRSMISYAVFCYKFHIRLVTERVHH